MLTLYFKCIECLYRCLGVLKQSLKYILIFVDNDVCMKQCDCTVRIFGFF